MVGNQEIPCENVSLPFSRFFVLQILQLSRFFIRECYRKLVVKHDVAAFVRHNVAGEGLTVPSRCPYFSINVERERLERNVGWIIVLAAVVELDLEPAL